MRLLGQFLNFFTKRFRVTSQNHLTKRIKTSKRMKIVCLFVCLFSVFVRAKKRKWKKEKSPLNVDVLNTDVPITSFM